MFAIENDPREEPVGIISELVDNIQLTKQAPSFCLHSGTSIITELLPQSQKTTGYPIGRREQYGGYTA